MNFIPASIAYAFGIYCSDYINPLIAVLSLLVFTALCFITHMYKKNIFADVIIISALFVCGIVQCFIASDFSNHSISAYFGRYVNLKGCICELPYDNYGINRYVVYVPSITCDGEEIPINEKLIINSDEEFKCGDSVSVFGQIKELRNQSGEYDVNPIRYYGARGIHSRMNAMSMELSDENISYFSPLYASNLIRSKIADTIRSYYKDDYSAVLIAVLTGDKHSFSDEYEAVLSRTGTKHLFYPSFAHLIIISMIICMFSGIIHKKIRDIVYALIILIYALFNSSNPTAFKSACAVLLVLLCGIIFKISSKKNMTALSVLIMGMINPLILFDAGLIFSVASMILLNLFMPYIKSKYLFIRLLWRYILLFVGMLPLSGYYFQHISPYSFWASLLFIPANMIVLLISPIFYINCLFGTPYPTAYLIRPFAMLMLKLPEFIDKLPLSSIAIPKPSVIIIIAWYIGAAALVFHLRKRISSAVMCAAISAGLFSSAMWNTLSDIDKIQLHFINVGQGDASLIRVPFSANILIDGGGSESYAEFNTGEKIFVPYLYSNGVGIVQAAFVSHFHKDHVEGIIAAVKNTEVKNLFIPDVMPESELRIELEKAAEEHGTKVWHISRTTTVKIDKLFITIFVPNEVTRLSDDENDTSLMINVEYGEFNCLFTGDMTTFSERNFLKYSTVPEAEVLKVAHHGSASSNSEAMIQAVNPSIALIGVGENNGYGHPSDEVLERLKNIEVLRTDLNGDILIKSDENADMEIHTYK